MLLKRSFLRVFSCQARTFNFILSAVLLGVSLSAPPVRAQDPTEDEVLRVTTDLLLFPTRIRDRHGKPPDGLQQEDLSLRDPDGVVSSLYFSRGVDRVAMVFALDESGSVRDVMRNQRDAAIELYGRFNSLSSIAVLHFSNHPQVASPFTRETGSARAAFEIAARPNRSTAIFDAAAKALEMFKALPRVRSERRIVILISDGLDNASAVKADAVVRAARFDRVSFYVIHLPLFEPRDGRLAVRRPAKGFRGLAEKTGGRYFLAGDTPLAPRAAIDLAPVFRAIEEDLRSQYLVGFYLTEKANDGGRHEFSLSMPPGVEYEIIPRGYGRSQKFLVQRPREVLKPRS